MDGFSTWHRLDISPMFESSPLMFTSSIVRSVSRSRWAGVGRFRFDPSFQGFFNKLVARRVEGWGVAAPPPSPQIAVRRCVHYTWPKLKASWDSEQFGHPYGRWYLSVKDGVVSASGYTPHYPKAKVGVVGRVIWIQAGEMDTSRWKSPISAFSYWIWMEVGRG